jgi:hypothetical protein
VVIAASLLWSVLELDHRKMAYMENDADDYFRAIYAKK